MDYKPFRTMCDSLPTQTQKAADNFCNSLPYMFPDDTFMMPRRVYALLSGSRARVIGRSNFYRRKKLTVLFYNWLLEQGLVDPRFVEWVSSLKLEFVVASREMDFRYYKSLDDVLGFITKVGASTGLGGYGDLLGLKSIVILAWHGVETSEMLKMQKADIDVGSSAVLISGDHTRTVVIPEKYLDILRYYATEDIHRGFPSGKKQVYRPSPFLFRAARLEKLDFENLHGLVNRFNDKARKYGRELSLPQLHRNGIFARVLEQDDGEKSINELIIKVSGCDKFLASELSRVYLMWKQRYA